MAFFSRAPKTSPIAAFWEWWISDGRAQAAASIAAGDYGNLPAKLTKLTSAIDPGLSWHFSKGASSQHALTVTAGGIADNRPLAERWLRAAPPADETFEYHSSQQADPTVRDAVVQLGGAKLAVGETVFGITSDDNRLDVGVFNPVYPDVPEGVRGQTTFLMLDWILGEDAVTRWLGAIEPLAAAPVSPRSISELQAAVAGLEAARDPGIWSTLSGQQADGTEVVVLAHTGMHWLDAPTLDLHHEITAGFADRGDGLPTPEELVRLQGEEEPLDGLLGERGALMAYVTGGGHRVIHYYTEGEDQNAAEAIATWANGVGRTTRSERDPAWHALRPYGI